MKEASSSYRFFLFTRFLSIGLFYSIFVQIAQREPEIFNSSLPPIKSLSRVNIKG